MGRFWSRGWGLALKEGVQGVFLLLREQVPIAPLHFLGRVAENLIDDSLIHPG
jgi:hypothetical protein